MARRSFYAALALAYVTEAWDACWAWLDGSSFLQAIDWGDWFCFTAGAVVKTAPSPVLYFA